MKTLKNKKGLSTVVTTLIILVVSVLLATVVTFYAINVTTTRVQEESIQVAKLHLWHNGTTFSEAAFLIVNTGGRDLVLDKISIRGQESAWDTIYYNKTTGAISPDLTYVTPNAPGTLTGKAMAFRECKRVFKPRLRCLVMLPTTSAQMIGSETSILMEELI